ncbi:unnamed protein product [Lupinus luteus]|uniref:pectinesterase n=1 Tax=Lupinus luteus TaxID=3873 RepID=A0AAV1VZ39_LUPLU
MQISKLFSFIFTFQVLVFSFCESQQCNKDNPITTISVSQGGNANFKTIQSAIDSIPAGNSKWIHITVDSGVYKEKVILPNTKPCVFLEGAGKEQTSVQWGDSGTAHHTSTFELQANYTLVKGITFQNNHNIVDEKKNVTPAVATRVHADKCTFIDCGFVGVQDTLFDSFGRHYYYNCYIHGHTDFIFGKGQSIFQDCKIYFGSGIAEPRDGVITANYRSSLDDPSAFVFKNCSIDGSPGIKTNLGRALELGNPRVIISDSYLADVIRPEGWNEVQAFVGSERNITFVEVGCRGPGSNMSGRVSWINKLSDSEINKLLDLSFIDNEGWTSNFPIKIIA